MFSERGICASVPGQNVTEALAAQMRNTAWHLGERPGGDGNREQDDGNEGRQVVNGRRFPTAGPSTAHGEIRGTPMEKRRPRCGWRIVGRQRHLGRVAAEVRVGKRRVGKRERVVVRAAVGRGEGCFGRVMPLLNIHSGHDG